jgi:hypothetical protein
MEIIQCNPLFIMTCVCLMNAYVYKFIIVETFDLEYDNLYALCVCIVSAIYADTRIVILLSSMYMLLCVSVTHMSYWEFLYMHPFVWSIIHSCDIDPQHFVALMSVRHVAYTLQSFTPEAIHTRISIAFAGGVYVLIEYTKKLNYVRHVDVVQWYFVCLHIMHNVIYLLLWMPSYTSVSVDIIQISVIIVMMGINRIITNMYVRCFFNSLVYALSYWIPMDMVLSVNRCITIGIKEEMYSRVFVVAYVRFFEHAISFVLFYLIHAMDIIIPNTLKIVLAVTLFTIQCIMHTMHKMNTPTTIDCRCTV